MENNQPKRLIRPQKGRMIGGVGLAFANYFNIDATLVRVLLVIFALIGGPGFILYFIFWLIIPSSDD